MKHLFFLLSFCCYYFQLCAQQPDFVWAKGMTGTAEVAVTECAVDAFGNVFTTGAFRGTTDFDSGSGTATRTPAGDMDIFICKFDAVGNFIWVKQIGGPGLDVAQSIYVDSDGNLYITGDFRDTVDFDPNGGVYPLISAGGSDAFVSKLDSAGNLLWAKSMGSATPSGDIGFEVAADGDGNVYTAGSFNDSADFNPGSGTFMLTATNTDIFVLKLDSAGNFIWAKQMGGASSEQSLAMTVDGAGNVYTTGWFQDSADFDPGPSVYNLYSPQSLVLEVFISKLDSAGNFVWAKSFASTNGLGNHGNGIGVDAAGNVYTVGQFRGTVDFNPGAAVFNLTALGADDIFIAKYSAGGNLLWAKQIGDGLSSLNDQGLAIEIDASGYAYITGTFNGTVDFNPGSAIANTTAIGDRDIYLLKLHAAGTFEWVATMGGILSDIALAVTLDNAGGVFLGGHFVGTADFDPGSSSSPITGSSNNRNGFVLKLQLCQTTFGTLSASACTRYVSPSGKFTWLASGTYADTIANAAGCDSILAVSVTIKNNKTSSMSESICTGSSFPFNGQNRTATGSYKDTMPASNGCDSIITLNLTVNALPQPAITKTDSTLSTGNFSSYQWLLNGSAIDSATAQQIPITQNGNFSVLVTDNNGCSDTSATTNVTGVGINEVAGFGVKLYPNPNKGSFVLEFDDNETRDITITDIAGKVFLSGIRVSARKEFHFDGAQGIYLIKIAGSHEARCIKFVVGL